MPLIIIMKTFIIFFKCFSIFENIPMIEIQIGKTYIYYFKYRSCTNLTKIIQCSSYITKIFFISKVKPFFLITDFEVLDAKDKNLV